MRLSIFLLAAASALCLAPFATAGAAHAQRHGIRSSPPTAPVPVAPTPLEPVSSGLGSIQFVQVNYGVPAPQALTRQLRADDDRTRAAALSAIGAPGQYLQHGHVPMPRSLDLQLTALSSADELDAILTAELDQHIVTAVLIPVDGNWRRIATLIFSTPFNDFSTTPSTWVRVARAFVQPDRYRAIFHGSSGNLRANFTENEAHLRIINGHAVITMSFESFARACATAPPPPGPLAAAPRRPDKTEKSGCNVTRRWFQADPTDPTHKFDLITASGHITPKEAAEPLANSRTVIESHLRSFACQSFVYSEQTQHYEPATTNAPCPR